MKVETFTAEEREAIRCCAARQHEARKKAIEVFHALLKRVRDGSGQLPYGDLYFEFMREVDSKCPDLGLRARYRAKITAGES